MNFWNSAQDLISDNSHWLLGIANPISAEQFAVITGLCLEAKEIRVFNELPAPAVFLLIPRSVCSPIMAGGCIPDTAEMVLMGSDEQQEEIKTWLTFAFNPGEVT